LLLDYRVFPSHLSSIFPADRVCTGRDSLDAFRLIQLSPSDPGSRYSGPRAQASSLSAVSADKMSVARKIGEREIEIFGLCILMSDQTMTPIHLRLQLSPTTNEVSWLELRLGERGRRGMVRMPYSSEGAVYKRLHALNERGDRIEWVYKVTFGEKCT
jgi:hypothetical protein